MKASRNTAFRKSLNIAIREYEALRTDFDNLGRMLLIHLLTDDRLKHLVHSGKHRTKDPAHLREKLKRKQIALESPKGTVPERTKIRDIILSKVDDLVGVRILHLYTRQMQHIHPAIMSILDTNRYSIVKAPVAYIWDNESRDFFQKLGLKTEDKEQMYTSVHYVISSASRPEMRIELQVRTLIEEVWGETSHKINYPDQTNLISCREQLAALAKITSGCGRLVDSIFVSYASSPTNLQKGTVKNRGRRKKLR